MTISSAPTFWSTFGNREDCCSFLQDLLIAEGRFLISSLMLGISASSLNYLDGELSATRPLKDLLGSDAHFAFFTLSRSFSPEHLLF
uniref:Uncharacterized protein n=1 Tax=Acidithiobacillus caldus TaxID=33059 RepID=Q840Q7_9PROT|nr:hypothetical protein [Acidithiobacillus caldus]